jgi:GT2 family glycosyltransferase
MKLSIVIICWNDLKVISDCLRSIYEGTHAAPFEIIVSDNGSTDNSLAFIRENYPDVRIVENGANLGFAKGNNAGIEASMGEYVLILNPDTIIHDKALDTWVSFADRHPEAGAFGCRVLNPDGSYQYSARPFPTIRSCWIAALCLRKLAFISKYFVSDVYVGWNGESERIIDWQSGCCVMFRRSLLKSLGGFDGQFFYHYEEVDLCRRLWNTGHSIYYTPEAVITHLGGQSVNRFPVRFALERYRNGYRYFYKHFGARAARHCRIINLAWLSLRGLGYGLQSLLNSSDAQNARLQMYRVSFRWNMRLDPVRFVLSGEEPELKSSY